MSEDRKGLKLVQGRQGDALAEWCAEYGDPDVYPVQGPRSTPLPEFKNRCVAEAYADLEGWLLYELRMTGCCRAIEHDVWALRVIDAAWAEPDGFVYLLQASSSSDREVFPYVKIGFSTSPDDRLKSLQTGCPVELSIFQTSPAPRAMEQAFHQALKGDRAHGEWYRWVPEAKALLFQLTAVADKWLFIRNGLL